MMMINEAREIKAIKKVARAKEANLQSILNNLPAGINVDDNGNLTGTALITHTPTKCEEKHVHFGRQGTSYQEIFQGVSRTNLARTLTINGVKLAHQAAIGDIVRHDFEFGPYRSSDVDPGLKQNKRIENAAEALSKFAGSEEATFVLSSLLHQGVPTMLQKCLVNAEGVAITCLRPIPKRDVVPGRKLAVLQADGSREDLPMRVNENGELRRDIGGMTRCKFKLSRHGDDFKLSIDWKTYYELQRDLDGNLAEGLPLGKEDVIAAHFETEFLIQVPIPKDKDDEPEMRLTTKGIQVTFSGRLDMSLI